MQFKQKLTESLIKQLVMEELAQLKEKNNTSENKETLQEGKLLNTVLAAFLAMSANAAEAKAKENPEAAAMAKKMMALHQKVINDVKSESPQNVQDVLATLKAGQDRIFKDSRLDQALVQAGENLKAAIKQQAGQNVKTKGPATNVPDEQPLKKRPRPFRPLPDLT